MPHVQRSDLDHPSTGKVVDHQLADHQKGDFNEFLKNRQKGVAWDDRFQKAREEEKKRKADIEQKFKKAKDAPDAGPEAPMSLPSIGTDTSLSLLLLYLPERMINETVCGGAVFYVGAELHT